MDWHKIQLLYADTNGLNDFLLKIDTKMMDINVSVFVFLVPFWDINKIYWMASKLCKTRHISISILKYIKKFYVMMVL